MNLLSFNRNTVFSALLLVVIASIIYRVIPTHVAPVFNLVISKNKVGIVDIHQARDIEVTKTVKVDRIELADKSRFRHAKLGDLGYSGDFFVDIEAPFIVRKAGSFTFYLGSDDGFVFSVDGKPICEWTHDRPLTVNACQINLNEGNHTFKLEYFQGFGNAGLTMAYAYTTDGKQYVAGDDSKYMRFVY